MRAPEPTVFVVDDHEDVRRSLCWLFESVRLAVQDYTDAESFLDVLRPEYPGCVVVDVRMPGIDGLEVLRRLRAQRACLPVIVITGHGDVPMAVAAMKLGAFDFLQKPVNHQQLLERVRAGLAEDARFRADFGNPMEIAGRFDTLTPKECEVLGCMLRGQPNKTIARGLGIGTRTVETHRANLMRKLQVRSVAGLVRVALAMGMLP